MRAVFYIIVWYSKALSGLQRLCCLKRSIIMPKYNSTMASPERIKSATCWIILRIDKICYLSELTNKTWLKYFCWKTTTHLSFIINVIAAENLSRCAARENTMIKQINSTNPERCGNNFESMTSKHVIQSSCLGSGGIISPIWILQNLGN